MTPDNAIVALTALPKNSILILVCKVLTIDGELLEFEAEAKDLSFNLTVEQQLAVCTKLIRNAKESRDAPA